MRNFESIDPAYIDRLRRSMRGAIGFARRRQAKKASPAIVDVTLDEMMEILRRQNYRCAISGLPFWCGSRVAYGPTIPSIDRMQEHLNPLPGRRSCRRAARALTAGRP